MSTGSSERYLTFWESYARQPFDEINSLPRPQGDFRERVDRATIRGRYAVFHENIEQYFYRQWRAYTCPRFAVFTFASYSLTMHALVSLKKTFPNLQSCSKFSAHPQYKVLGPIYSYFYLLRPLFWSYICYRMTRTLGAMIYRHWFPSPEGKDDQHYFWYYDTLYPDMFHDADDMRYINFRYTDNKVVPDGLTGYYPYQQIRYGDFLNKKEDSSYTYKSMAPSADGQ